LRSFPIIYNYVSRKLEQKIIADLKTEQKPINADMYKAYSENLRKAVGGVLTSDNYGDKHWETQMQMQANVSRFAAYKAHQATQEILQHLDSADFDKKAKLILNKYNRFQVAEHNTTVARTRTAKQWVDFTEDDFKNEMYPNLKWLPSSSATPREEHRAFYGLVLPKTDPFWNDNYPGNLWNCKCDWEETDEPAFGGEVKSVAPHKGLGGNPAKDKMIFTDDAGYIKNAGKEAIESVAQCYFPDKEGKLQISVMPDMKELTNNIYTGRILAKHNDVETIEIRPHFPNKPGEKRTNPEYMINGMLADAKRMLSPNGIPDGFAKAKKQGCRIVIIDFDKHLKNKKISHYDIAKKISWRGGDFENNIIKECYIIHNDNCLKINKKNYANREWIKRMLQKKGM
jgi:hypothetical protein